MLHVLSFLAIAIILELPSYIGISIVTGMCLSEKYCYKIYSDNSSVNGASVKAIFAKRLCFYKHSLIMF